MFYRDEDLNRVRIAFSTVGIDMKEFKKWQKQYEKVNKQWQNVRENYREARIVTGRVEELSEQLENMLIGNGAVDRAVFGGILKELKHLQNSFDHEFIISRDDVQFHSTYDTILKLGAKATESDSQRIILQSEVENLLDLLRENLAKPVPEPRKLTFYYLFGSDGELSVLPPAERVAKIERIYEARFVRPIMEMLIEAIKRADETAARIGGRDDRKSRKTLDALEVLLEVRGNPHDRARGIFEVLMA